jgi:hypothetical protein
VDKRAIGKARVASLEALLHDLMGQDDTTLSKTLSSNLFKKDGTFHLGKLAESIGHDCEQTTFRQNNNLRERVDVAEAEIRARGLLSKSSIDPVAPTKRAIGDENEAKFLDWLARVGTEQIPAPVSHTRRLYRKALWATYSGQALLDVERVPTWFNSRPKVREALNELDVRVVQNSVVTIRMDSDSIADDMEDTMTSTLVRKLRAEIKTLKEQLAAEREARRKAELEAKQNEWQAQLITTGKMPHKE